MDSVFIMAATIATTFFITKAKHNKLKENNPEKASAQNLAGACSGTMYISFSCSVIFFMGLFLAEFALIAAGLAGYALLYKIYFTNHELD